MVPRNGKSTHDFPMAFERNYFTEIYKAAKAKNLARLEEILTEVTLYVSSQGNKYANPVVKLAAEKKHDAIAFLSERFDIKKGMVAGYALAGDIVRVNNIILATKGDVVKLELFNEAIMAYAVTGNSELDAICSKALELAGDSEERRRAIEVAKLSGIVKGNFEERLTNLTDANLLITIAYHLAVQGNTLYNTLFKKIKNCDENNWAVNKVKLVFQIARGLARGLAHRKGGNYIAKLDVLAKDNKALRRIILFAEMQGFAEVYNATQINFIFGMVGFNLDLAEAVIIGYLIGGYIGVAKNVFNFTCQSFPNEIQGLFERVTAASIAYNNVLGILKFAKKIANSPKEQPICSAEG